MKNVSTISVLANHLKDSAERLSNLAFDVDSADDGYRPEGFGELMDEQFAAELAFAQRCLIMLTSLVTDSSQTTNGDDTAFMAGELNSEVEAEGDETVEAEPEAVSEKEDE